MKQTVKQLIALIQTDMYRYGATYGFMVFLKLLIKQKGFIASFHFRINRFLYLNNYFLLLTFAKITNRICQEYHQYELPHTCKIGPGLAIYHLNGMILNKSTVIGKNANLSHQITIGEKPTSSGPKLPILLDNVFVAPGAKIIGDVIVGNHVAVGANAVLTKSAPDYSVMVGIPAKNISNSGSLSYCVHTDYESKIQHIPSKDNY